LRRCSIRTFRSIRWPGSCSQARSPLKELLVETGQGLSAPGIKEYLGGLSVSGKTAKLTRDLLGIEVNADHSSRRAAATQALAGRTQRAERWMQCRRQAEDNHEPRALRVEPRKLV
jgi:hypothetical protein